MLSWFRQLWLHSSAFRGFCFLAVFTVAALMEVMGDAAMRENVSKGKSGWYIAGGFILLSGYGYLVTHVPWDFSKLLGVYVVAFAWVGVLWGRQVNDDVIPMTTWFGLTIITLGGLLIQFGPDLTRRWLTSSR